MATSSVGCIIGTQTLLPGGPAIAVGDTHYSLDNKATAFVSGASTLPLVQPSQEMPVLTVAGVAQHPTSVSNIAFGSQTPVSSSSDTTISQLVMSSNIATSHAFSLDVGTSAAPPELTLRGNVHPPDSSSRFGIGSQSLYPGGPAITISGKIYSLANSASALISDGSTIPLFTSISPSLPAVTVGGIIYHANTISQFTIEIQTLSPGGSPITINGNTYSLAPTATALASGSSTIPLTAENVPRPSVITIAGSTYSEAANSGYLVGSQTLIPNGSLIVVGSTSYALLSGKSGNSLVVAISSTVPSQQNGGSAKVITIGSASYTADSASNFVIGGQTLAPGSMIILSGTPVSFDAHGSDVVVGSSTEQVSLASLIIRGLGEDPRLQAVTHYRRAANQHPPRVLRVPR